MKCFAYIAFGAKYGAMFKRSLHTLRAASNFAPVVVLCDAAADLSHLSSKDFSAGAGVYLVRVDTETGYKDSANDPMMLAGLYKSEVLFKLSDMGYKNIVFLDCDTYILGNLDVLFYTNGADLALDYYPTVFDVVEAESNVKGIKLLEDEVPLPNKYHNTGVYAVKDTRDTRCLFAMWQKYMVAAAGRDQYAFAAAAKHHVLGTLPPEYNYFPKVGDTSESLYIKGVQIVHFHGPAQQAFLNFK